MCERVLALLQDAGVELVVCDLGALRHPDAGSVDALARLRLSARRLGCRVVVVNPSARLLELVELMGLAEALLVPGALPLDRPRALGQPEQGEHPRRVEEEGQAADPVP